MPVRDVPRLAYGVRVSAADRRTAVVRRPKAVAAVRGKSCVVLAIAALLGAISSKPGPLDVRIMRTHSSAHFVRVRYRVEIAGVEGSEVGLYDLADGRYVERLAAGPLSTTTGFDGTHSWSADVTGFAQIDDHPNTVLDELATAHFQGRRGPEQPSSVAIRGRTGGTLKVVLTYAGLAGPIGVTLSEPAGRVLAVDDYAQMEATHTRLSDYRTVDGIEMPFTTIQTSPERTSVERIERVDVLTNIADSAFRAPAPPHDWSVRGGNATTVALTGLDRDEPIVDVSIDGEAPLRMLLDSGGSNTMSGRAARRLGLRQTGYDRTGGIGLGMLGERYAMVRTMRIGAAVLRDQPFEIFDDKTSDTDGTIGCEVLERFVARFDFPKRRLTLAMRDTFRENHEAIPMHLEGCQPEIEATMDGFTGAFAIDTGSGSAIDVMAPFVRSHHLIARYGAKVRFDGMGIGGAIYAGSAKAKHFDIGDYIFDGVPIDLSTMRGGAFDDPTQIGNLGVELLNGFVMTLDYRARRMWLDS